MSAYGDIAAMATLLGGRDPDDTESPGPSGAPFNPGALPVAKDDGVAIPAVRPGKKDAKAIWDVSELVDDFDDDSSEEGEDGSGLRIPTYEFMYKQAINTADAFLGMAHNKDPGSRSCEDMVLKIHLPGTRSMRELDLEVETDRLRLRSATYKLPISTRSSLSRTTVGGSAPCAAEVSPTVCSCATAAARAAMTKAVCFRS